jgi:hypothetical protein
MSSSKLTIEPASPSAAAAVAAVPSFSGMLANSAAASMMSSMVSSMMPLAERLITGLFDRMDRQNEMMREFVKDQNAMTRELIASTAHRAAERAVATSKKRESHVDLDVKLYKTAVLAASAPGLMVFVLEMGADAERIMFFDTSKPKLTMSGDTVVSAQTCADMVSGGKLELSTNTQSVSSLVKFVAREVPGRGGRMTKEKWSDMVPNKVVRDEVSVIVKGVQSLTGRTLHPVPMASFMGKIGQCREASFEEPTQSGFDVVAHSAARHTAMQSTMIRAAIEDVCKTSTKWLAVDDTGAWVVAPWSNVVVEVIAYNRTQASRGDAVGRVPLRRMPVPVDPDDDERAEAMSPQPRLIVAADADDDVDMKKKRKRAPRKAAKTAAAAKKRKATVVAKPAPDEDEDDVVSDVSDDDD